MSQIYSRSKNGKWTVHFNLTQYYIQPMCFNGYRITLHQVEAVILSPLSALYDPNGRLKLSIWTIHPTIQLFLC